MKEVVLVCLSSSSSNHKSIESAMDMAHAYQADFIALYVETSRKKSKESIQQLNKNIEYAQNCKAKVNRVFGEDIPFQISQFAHHSGVTRIVLGQSVSYPFSIGRPSISDELISYVSNISVYVIPNRNEHPETMELASFQWKDIFTMLVVLTVTSFISILISKTGMNDADIITIYILGVLIHSLLSPSLLLNGIDSFLSVIVFNFLFTNPKYTLLYYDNGYLLTFAIMFCSSMITGTLAWRLKTHAYSASFSAHQTKTLLDTNQLLSHAKETNEILSVTISQLKSIFNRNLVLYTKPNTLFYFEKEDEMCLVSERKIVEWVFEHHKQAGKGTNMFSDAKYFYCALGFDERIHGVFGIRLDKPLDISEKNILLSILTECSMALENEKNAREKEESMIRANNEKMRADLLRTISHDLRTPLTSIIGNSSTLLKNKDMLSENDKMSMVNNIYKDSIWLSEMVENLLSVTRIEQGKIKLNKNLEIVEEVIEEAYHKIHNDTHHFIFVPCTKIYTAWMDAKLMIQVFVNIFNNAIKYVDDKYPIQISIEEDEHYIYVRIQDHGKGIEDKEKIFEMFYRGKHDIVDDERGLGLGLALCKSILNLHGGKIWVEDTIPHGSTFVVALVKGKEYE
ncbi:ATP-binding protein [Floccifex sp.]|uniref:ATP-binding protein n=1 Tax=Floccifex sp. TaxID=2815810 RepID=UPI003F113CCC